MKKFRLSKIFFIYFSVLFFVFMFSFNNSVCAITQAKTYTVSCINYEPMTVSLNGDIISGLEQIPQTYKDAFAVKIKEYVTRWDRWTAIQQQTALSALDHYYGLTCSIKNNETDTTISAQSLFVSEPSKPLIFTPEVGFPGFSGPITVDGYLFGKFIFALFHYLLYASGVLAVIFVSIAGFKWVSAGGNQSKITEAKNQMINSITGMFLVFATFLILSTVNEDLVIMKEIKLDTITPVELAEGSSIEKANDFKGENRTKTEYIIIHTAAGIATRNEVDAFHKKSGWSGIGYNFYIERNGSWVIGRGEMKRGAHTTSNGVGVNSGKVFNSNSIGISYSGCAQRTPPINQSLRNAVAQETITQAQLNTLISHIKDLQSKYNIPKERVLGHSELGAAKACPCINMNEIRAQIN